MSALWRIEQLAELAALALDAASFGGQPSGRVREVPDARTIRYYTTIGLLDRPQEMRGRTAFYGRRHLLQLVAIKRMQARGLPLVEIQRNLAGSDDKTLSRWADLPAGFLDRAGVDGERRGRRGSPSIATGTRGDQPGDESRRKRFWTAAPSLAAAPRPAAVQAAPLVRPAVVLQLGSGVSLVIEREHAGAVDEARLAGLGPAAAALIAALKRVGILDTEKPLSQADEDHLT